MHSSKLSDHKFVKGKFVTPLNSISGMTVLERGKQWYTGRLPEYLWIGLIFERFGRDRGLKLLNKIIKNLRVIAPEMLLPRLSVMLSFSEEKQRCIFETIKSELPKNALAPLTIILTREVAPVFSECFFDVEETIANREKALLEALNNYSDQYSNGATDIRFIVLYAVILAGKIQLMEHDYQLLSKYPFTDRNDIENKMASATIRMSEMILMQFEEVSDKFLNIFWRGISEMTDCTLYGVYYPAEERDIRPYINDVKTILEYLSNIYTQVQPLDEKMKVLIGIATFSLKRFQEIVDHNLYNTVAGRSCVRSMIEAYIMMKYLVANEKKHENIWLEYQLYGLGQYKLVLQRHRDLEAKGDSHFDINYIEQLVNEYRDEAFTDMDTKYFDKQNIRMKAETVQEKELYGLYYDYDSAFEHALWGAIRESVLLKCTNPAHQFHCVPDIDGRQNLKSVLGDCVMVMNKTITFLKEIYGIPEEMYQEVLRFEEQLTNEKGDRTAE